MPKKIENRWLLDVGYQLTESEDGELNFSLDKDLESVLGSRNSSGAGFGYRDLQWVFPDKILADQASLKAAVIFKKKKLKITVVTDDTDVEKMNTAAYISVRLNEYATSK